jgi:hypothetical protein
MKIIILCKSPEKLASALQFLRKRNISAQAFSKLQDFVTQLEAGSFDMMAISLSFGHPKVEKIPLLMQQMFKLPAIVFVEEFTKQSQHLLQNPEHKHRISDQISGPALEMAATRVMREKELDHISSSGVGPSQSGTELEDGRVFVMSGSHGAKNTTFVSKGEELEADRSVSKGSTSSTIGQDISMQLMRLPNTNMSAAIAAKKPPTDFMTLWVCALAAMKEVAGEGSTPISKVENPGRCLVLNLHSPSAHGTFVFTTGAEQDAMSDLASMMIEDLFAQMKNHELGHPEESEYETIEIAENLVKEEVLSRARFNSAREGMMCQIGIAYIDHADMLSYSEFDDVDVREVPILSIQPQTELPFQLYLKLSVSCRYLNYINRGRKLHESQAARMIGYGLRNFYVHASDYDKYLAHVASQQLNDELVKRGMRLIKKGAA